MFIKTYLLSNPLLFLIFRILSVIFIGIWTYRDANNKNNKDYLIWTLVAMIIPYYLGVILYILVGRKTSKVYCDKCHNYTEANRPYCSLCGSKLNINIKDHKFHKNNNIWIILSALSIFIAYLIPMIFFGRNLFFWQGNNKLKNSINDFDNFMEYSQYNTGENIDRNNNITRENKFNWKFKNDNKKMINKIVYVKDEEDFQNIKIDYKIKKGTVNIKTFINGNEFSNIKINEEKGTKKLNLNDLVKDAGLEDEDYVDIYFIFYPKDASGNINMDYVKEN